MSLKNDLLQKCMCIYSSNKLRKCKKKKTKKIERRLNFILSNKREHTMLMKSQTSLPKSMLLWNF